MSPTRPNGASSGVPALDVRDISLHFDGVQALSNLSFSAEAGEITAIIGPNGAGKTTLFNILSGVVKPTSGTVHFNGEDVTGGPPHSVTARGLARTFQNIALFPHMRVIENVMVGQYGRLRARSIDSVLWGRAATRRRWAVERAEDLLELVGIAPARNQFPPELPYGDQRRLEIARALATEPTCLLLDEPTAGMIPAEVDEIVRIIRILTERGITVLIVEHNMGLVMNLADKMIVLNFGVKIAEGEPTTIRTDPAVIVAYLGEDE